MKRTILIAFILLLSNCITAQDYCAFLPYSYNGLYGIVNDKQEKIVEPKYKNLKIIGDYSFALFDGINCYDLHSGSYIQLDKAKQDSFLELNNELFIFNSASNILTNPFTKEKINLSLKYSFFMDPTFYDPIAKKNHKLVIARTIDEQNLFLNNDKSLSPAIKGKFGLFEYNTVDIFVDGEEKSIGLIVLNKDQTLTCYNYNLTKSFQLKKEDFEKVTADEITFKQSVNQKFIDFYGIKYDSFLSSFAKGPQMKMGAESGRFFSRFIDRIELGNEFYLKAYDYNYKLMGPNKSNLKVEFDNIYQSGNSKILKFNSSGNEKFEIFVNHPRINPSFLMFPKEELIRFGFIN